MMLASEKLPSASKQAQAADWTESESNLYDDEINYTRVRTGFLACLDIIVLFQIASEPEKGSGDLGYVATLLEIISCGILLIAICANLLCFYYAAAYSGPGVVSFKNRTFLFCALALGQAWLIEYALFSVWLVADWVDVLIFCSMVACFGSLMYPVFQQRRDLWHSQYQESQKVVYREIPEGVDPILGMHASASAEHP